MAQTSSPSSCDVDDAIEKVGMGSGQWILFALVALFLLADGAEVSYLSYVTRVLQVEWGFSEKVEASIISMVFWGEVVGAPVWGILADKVGRRPAFLLSALVISVAGFATAICSSVFHLAMAFTVACALPTTVAFLLSVWLLPESAQWLASQGRGREAGRVVTSWARWNGSPQEFDSLTVPQKLEDVSFASLANDSKLRRKFLLSSVVWLGFGAAFYGISFFVPHLFSEVTTDSSAGTNSTDSDITSISTVTFNFKDILIANSSQIVGLVFGVLLIDRAGRKPVQIIGFLFAGAMSFFLGFKSLGKTAIVIFSSLASAGENAASTCTWVHTPELFPTKVRALAHSLLNAWARVGGAIAPHFVAMPVPWSAFLIAGFSAVAGFAVCGLEETVGKSLDDGRDVETDLDDSDSNSSETD